MLPTTMQAVISKHRQSLDGLQIEERPVPTVQPHEILLRVKAAALNRRDLLIQTGGLAGHKNLWEIPGTEAAGEIAALGQDVTEFELGERVVVVPGATVYGTLAEFVAVPADSVVTLPDDVTFEDAVAQTLSAGLAWNALVNRAGVRPGEWVLIHAAGSGLGVAAIQVAKMWGASVIATASRSEKLEKALELGADETLNYTAQDWVAATFRLTDGRGADVVLDTIGPATLAQSAACLARDGRLITCGSVESGVATLDIWQLIERQAMLIAAFPPDPATVAEVLRLTDEGRLSAVIAHTFALSSIRTAYQYLSDRTNFGKIIISN